MKSKIFSLFIFTAFTLFISGCGPAMATKSSEFPKMYEQAPRSILILPPMNNSSDAQAKDYYMTTVEMPFALMGYYTFPTEMVSEIMKQEGVYDTELLYNMPVAKFYDYFGADTVLFTTINRWDVSYAVLASSLTVSISSKLVSTKSNETLWSYTGTVYVDLSAGGGAGGGGLAELLVDAIATAINTAAADYVDYAKQANNRIIHSLPAGPYSPMYMKDQNVQIVDQTPPKSN